jgi:tetratricopeptide (TPR) repeat protein
LAAAEAYHRQRPADTKAQNLLASANFTAALTVGSDEALTHWNASGALYAAMLAEDPNNLQALRNVGLVEKYLGDHYESAGDYPSALAHHERARQVDEQRLALNSTDRTAQGDVAVDLSNVAYNYSQQGHAELAVSFYERSLAMREQLSASDPADQLTQRRLAFVHQKLAGVYQDLQQIPTALEHARAAVRIYDDSIHTGDSSVWEVAVAQRTAADLEAMSGHHAAACVAYERVATTLRTIDPNGAFRRQLPAALESLGAKTAGCRGEDTQAAQRK